MKVIDLNMLLQMTQVIVTHLIYMALNTQSYSQSYFKTGLVFCTCDKVLNDTSEINCKGYSFQIRLLTFQFST